MSFADHWRRYGKCTAGTVGGFGAGILAGAAVGSAIPLLGTIGCGFVGGICGLLSGAAAACS